MGGAAGGAGCTPPLSPGTKVPPVGCSKPAQTQSHARRWRTTRTADADNAGRAEGQGQDQAARRGAPTGAGPLLKAVRSPDDPRRETGPEDEGTATAGAGSPLAFLRDRHRGRQKKVCWMPANSGTRPVGLPGRERSTRRCSEAVELCAGEAAAVIF